MRGWHLGGKRICREIESTLEKKLADSVSADLLQISSSVGSAPSEPWEGTASRNQTVTFLETGVSPEQEG